MKKEGINKKYFYDFIKYKRNQNNKDFQKEMFNILTTFSNIIESYRTFGIDQIFNYGTPTFKNYNSNKLKTLLILYILKYLKKDNNIINMNYE